MLLFQWYYQYKRIWSDNIKIDESHTKYSYLSYWVCDDQKKPNNL